MNIIPGRPLTAISLWQPWGSLWLSPAKAHETRHWPIKHRGPLLVHAAKRMEFDHSERMNNILDSEFGGHWGMDLARGALLGIVDLVDCVRTSDLYLNRADMTEDQLDDMECGDHSYGRFAWRRGTYRKFPKPIPYRGRQRLFSVPHEVVAEQIAASTEIAS